MCSQMWLLTEDASQSMKRRLNGPSLEPYFLFLGHPLDNALYDLKMGPYSDRNIRLFLTLLNPLIPLTLLNPLNPLINFLQANRNL